MSVRLTAPLTKEDVAGLHAGDRVLIDGTIYTARDAAHKKLVELIAAGKQLPVDFEGQILYYVGPTPPAPGKATGSAGPTTSSRMDRYTPALLKQGVRVLIGKGDRNEDVVSALKEQGAVYLAAVGGAGALLAQRIDSAEPVAYPELGTEAIFRMGVKEFPAIVVIDSSGNNLYHDGRRRFRRGA